MDGGGTNTRALIIDGSGQGHGLAKSGPSNYDYVGIEIARKNIGDAVQAAWNRAGLKPRPAAGIFLGIAGVTGMADRTTIEVIASKLHLAEPARVGVDHDIRILLAGGLGGEPGIALIVGTGSSCYARNATGNAFKVGGFGPLVDDLGSGYALGVQAMRAAAFAADGRGPATSLSEAVMGFLDITSMDNFLRRVHHDGLTRTQIASLAPMVVSCAQTGDGIAMDILRRGAIDLAEMVAAIVRQMGCDGPLALVIGGGLGEAETIYRQELLQALRRLAPQITITQPLFPAVAGAALLAMEAAGKRFGTKERENLAEFLAKEACRTC